MPGGDSTSYNRETLLGEVWAEPMRNIAKRCGITDLCLARIRRKLSVPLSNRGHSANVQAGQSPS